MPSTLLSSVLESQGAAKDLLERACESAAPALAEFGWQLAGALTTAMENDDKALLLWSIPTWHAADHLVGTTPSPPST